MRFSRIIFSIAAVFLMARPVTPQGAQPVTLVIGLADGSRIVGTPMTQNFPFTTSYASMHLGVDVIQSIVFEKGGETAKVILHNGDVLHGAFAFNALSVETSLGAQSIPLALISTITNRGRDLPAGPVLFYSLDDITEGHIPDQSGHKNDGTATGIVVDREGGSAPARFKGEQSFIECPDSPTLNMHAGFSFLAWLEPTLWATGNSSGIVSKKESDYGNGYVLYDDGYSPLQLNLRIRGTSGSANMLHSNAHVDVRVLQHWAVTYDAAAGEVRFYKNGSQDTIYMKVHVGDMSNRMPLHIGHAQTWGGCFQGRLGYVMIYDRALTPEEVDRVYDAQKATDR